MEGLFFGILRYVSIFPEPNFLSPEWRCPLKRGVSKESFHCIYVSILWKKRMVSLRCSGLETKIYKQKYIKEIKGDVKNQP